MIDILKSGVHVTFKTKNGWEASFAGADPIENTHVALWKAYPDKGTETKFWVYLFRHALRISIGKRVFVPAEEIGAFDPTDHIATFIENVVVSSPETLDQMETRIKAWLAV